jgi:hypothetical protein
MNPTNLPPSSEQDAIVRDLCRILFVETTDIKRAGIAIDDYPALERYFKCPGWLTNPVKIAEASRALSDHKAVQRKMWEMSGRPRALRDSFARWQAFQG